LICDVVTFALARVTAAANRRPFNADQVQEWSDRAATLMADTRVAHEEFRDVIYNEETGTIDPS
jgi:hypothetical protein